MNYLVTLNVNDWIPANVAESHADAARRWDARYIQIENAPPEGMYAAKSNLWRLGFKREDRIAWVDGDAIIREDCPSLFDFPDTHFCAVRSIQSGNPMTPKMAEYFRVAESNQPGAMDDWRDYLNSGVFVLSGRDMWAYRAAWGMAESYRLLLGEPTIGSGVEETALTVAMHTMSTVAYLDAAYNRLGPSAWAGKWTEDDGSQNYILHLAGGPWADGDKRERLAAIDWRVAVGAAP